MFQNVCAEKEQTFKHLIPFIFVPPEIKIHSFQSGHSEEGCKMNDTINKLI